MDFAKAVGLKLLFTSITILSLLSVFSDATLTRMFLIILIIASVSFIVGDLFLLKKVSSMTATLLDFPIYLLMVWLLSDLLLFADITEAIGVPIMAAVFLTVLEPFVHIKLRYAARKETKPAFNNRSYQTEFGEEQMEKDEKS